MHTSKKLMTELKAAREKISKLEDEVQELGYEIMEINELNDM